jgi:hypothetical protein
MCAGLGKFRLDFPSSLLRSSFDCAVVFGGPSDIPGPGDIKKPKSMLGIGTMLGLALLSNDLISIVLAPGGSG